MNVLFAVSSVLLSTMMIGSCSMAYTLHYDSAFLYGRLIATLKEMRVSVTELEKRRPSVIKA